MENVIHSKYRLGAMPAQTKEGQPMLHQLSMFCRMPPVLCDKSAIKIKPILGNNDSIGDCTAVGLVNSAIAIQAMNACGLACSDDDAVAFYEISTGYTPPNEETDRGGVEIDVLACAFNKGIVMGGHPYHPVWGTFDAKNQNNLALCTVGLGSTYLGLDLALADQNTVGTLWDTDTLGDQTPGSWGGHCALLWDYKGLHDEDEVTIITWGTKQRATWRWLRSRITEAHGVMWPQLVSPVNGFFTQANYNTIREQNLAFLS